VGDRRDGGDRRARRLVLGARGCSPDSRS
jgi:hypothetical protein